MTDQSYLVLFDADRIKEFVFATGRLKEIRGGSQIVRDATDAAEIGKALGLAPDQIVFAEGGSGLLLAADANSARDLGRRLALRYKGLTHGATLTAVAEPLGDDFGETIGRAARRLRLAKDDVRQRRQPAQSPFTQPCTSCGTQPAASTYRRGAGATERLCDACRAKRDAADALWDKAREGDEILLGRTTWGAGFLDSLPEERRAKWRDVLLAGDLTDLAALSRPGNYLGFLYADGNGLGDRLQDCHTEDEYRHFSRRVSHSMRAALWLALQNHSPEPEKREKEAWAPFELIALGGDDVILVTVADRVVPLAITLARLFAQISAGLSGVEKPEDLTLERGLAVGRERMLRLEQSPEGEDPLTLSCGIVIAHPGQPILNLEQRARELLRSAKAGFPGQAALDFHVVSTPVLRDLGDIRREEYRLPDETQLTVRPLDLGQAEKLLYHIREFKRGGESAALPRNKLNALYQALFAGRDAASFEAFFLRSRLSQDQQRKLDEFFKAFEIATISPADADTPLIPWSKREPDTFFTVFGDLIELYEFTHVEAPRSNGQEAGHGSVHD